MRLSLLGGFQLVIDGEGVVVPASSQRVLAFLGLHTRPQQRPHVARILWHEMTDQRAIANLRAALWKLHAIRERVIAAPTDRLSLRLDVGVDVADVLDRARELLDVARDTRVGEPAESAELLELFSNDVLPSWEDDWVVFERERVRQLRIHAIEAMSVRLSRENRHAEAVEAGLAAVAADPLRESAQRVLIEAHLAEGNAADARRQFAAFCDLLSRDLGVRPSPVLSALVAGRSPRDGLAE
ncbi:DNA-binding SARP family transcriptional activator [Nocardioides sp. BE266]|uniref:AfsR/SARP family transcriptional regulator n=1 Tax=Nocardioides sp. BE266 TaxID=2817725 RepID=UPI002861960A|nr:BTAD domain-containing putative transcriptional regulator [Nocardioides sp. BE266]MDR7254293.1 DNA-binding SARP family transcriptional activator [Nocardioides sp. BE266]